MSICKTRQDLRILQSSAANQLKTASRENFAPYLYSLLTVISTTKQQLDILNAADLATKNAWTSCELRWGLIPDESHQKIKDGLSQSLGDDQRAVRQVSGQTVAAVELPLAGLIGQLPHVIKVRQWCATIASYFTSYLLSL
ncbi:hypothetical protein DFH28DRAFT_927314 [Melampsora americana]|nr:hypothetical protein DFH28DRAFT_927314 [Melampsora americana]